MQGKYPFVIQSYYPHMKPADIHIWEKFIRANAGFFDSVDYDVPVGEVPEWMDTENDPHAQGQAILYKKKIDVVAYRPGEIWLIELKPFAGSSALGQILTYDILFKRKHQGAEVIRPCVITNKCANGFPDLFHTKGIACTETGICSQCAHYPSI